MNKKKRRRGPGKITNLSERILKILKADHHKTYNYKQIAAKLDVDDPSSRNQIIKNLQQLKAKEQIVEEGRGQFKIAANKNYHTGILDVSGKGGGYVMVDDLEQDIYLGKKEIDKKLFDYCKAFKNMMKNFLKTSKGLLFLIILVGQSQVVDAKSIFIKSN